MIRRILQWISGFLAILLKQVGLLKAFSSGFSFSFSFVLMLVYSLTLFASYSYLQRRATYLVHEVKEKAQQQKILNPEHFYQTALGSKTKNLSNTTKNPYNSTYLQIASNPVSEAKEKATELLNAENFHPESFGSKIKNISSTTKNQHITNNLVTDNVLGEKRESILEEKGKENDDNAEADIIRLQLLDTFDHEKAKRRNRQFYEQQVELLPPQTKGVILLTNYRSGSTFLGEHFNQHQNAFYIFEPLYFVTNKCNQHTELKTQILHQLLKCEFRRFTDTYPRELLPDRSNHLRRACLINDFCFRDLTKELCQRDQCANYIYGNKGCRECGPVHLSLAMNACRAKQLTVIKVIRYCDIMNLKPILTDPNMDVKVIHLIRDPRGIESSRLKLKPHWKIEGNAERLCTRVLNIGLRNKNYNSTTDWLKNRYMRVRYEDMSLKPFSWAEQIYKFVGLPFTPEMKEWIKTNTQAQANSYANPYGTKRNSTVAMQSWRKRLSLKQVLTIQNECREMMKFYGYKNVANQTELLDLQKMLFT